jgi:tRNA A37 N6-isopentenylltransferase MiaA
VSSRKEKNQSAFSSDLKAYQKVKMSQERDCLGSLERQLSKGSLQKTEELDSEAEKKIHEIQIEREKRRLEIINKRGLLLKERMLRKQNSIIEKNQKRTAIEEIEQDSNNASTER